MSDISAGAMQCSAVHAVHAFTQQKESAMTRISGIVIRMCMTIHMTKKEKNMCHKYTQK